MVSNVKNIFSEAHFDTILCFLSNFDSFLSNFETILRFFVKAMVGEDSFKENAALRNARVQKRDPPPPPHTVWSRRAFELVHFVGEAFLN